jgi:hypothetical protein
MGNFYLKMAMESNAFLADRALRRGASRRNVFLVGCVAKHRAVMSFSWAASPSIVPQCLSRGTSPSIVPQCLSRGTSPSIKERRFEIADE